MLSPRIWPLVISAAGIASRSMRVDINPIIFGSTPLLSDLFSRSSSPSHFGQYDVRSCDDEVYSGTGPVSTSFSFRLINLLRSLLQTESRLRRLLGRSGIRFVDCLPPKRVTLLQTLSLLAGQGIVMTSSRTEGRLISSYPCVSLLFAGSACPLETLG
jgi:hypothetical protein